MATRRDIYRVTGMRPWASEGTTEVPQPAKKVRP
jgi:hypothetical protein